MFDIAWLQQLKTSLELSQHRQLIVISGEHNWRWQQVELVKQVYTDPLILSQSEHISVWPEHNHQLLGQEFSSLVFDTTSGLMPDKLASVAGTIKAGGVLVLLVPHLDDYAQHPDQAFMRFQTHGKERQSSSYFQSWVAHFCRKKDTLLVQQDQSFTPPLIMTTTASKESPFGATEQLDIVVELDHFITQKRKACFLLTADRGRGKSAALGMLAAKQCNAGKTVAICAHHKNTLNSAFKHFLEEIEDKTHQLMFITPDQLLTHGDNIDVLLIDEAATLPVPLLKKVLDLPCKIGFATTLHGYEGTGRGFNLRFIPYLKTKRRQSRILELTQPIRYSENDPLEQQINELLLLNADFQSVTYNQEQSALNREVTQQELVSNPNLLKQLFAVLVMAHYQTTVNDLRHLLDGNNLKIYVTEQGNVVIAAALVALEGQISSQLADDIIAGKRRPQGNLLPQSIAAITANKNDLSDTYARIVRIAVNPYCQGTTVGTKLLNHIEKRLSDKVDYIGASFGTEVRLLSFWQRQAYRTVKLGIKQDKASGEHSCIVLKQVNKKNDLKTITERFNQFLFCELARSFRHLPSELVLQIMSSTNAEVHKNTLEDKTKRLLTQYTNFIDIRYLMLNLIQQSPDRLKYLEKDASKLLIMLVLQSCDERTVLHAMNFTGKKQLNLAVKNAVHQWCATYRAC